MPQQSYRRLDPAKVVSTTETLARRVRERFPDAGLATLADEILQVSRETAERSEAIRRPSWVLRCLALTAFLGIPLAVILAEQQIVGTRVGRVAGLGDFVQTLESTLGVLVFLSAAIYFFFSLETRRRRSRTLAAIAELRSLAHIIDMHQLAKGPDRFLPGRRSTASSPKVDLTRFQMERYLDYCSELLSIIGKISALYIQGFYDVPAVGAVDEVQTLTAALSRKIWQKITLLRRAVEATPEPNAG